ncbi:MAG: helix-turn-helix transcriptional regulator [Clostridia bacterium]|nr:helix-turn-helix transcriptional regulator [Clostridia bacterium]
MSNFFYVKDTKIIIVKDYFSHNSILSSVKNFSVEKILQTHFHFSYEVFIIGDKPLKFVTKTETFSFSNTVLIVPPMFFHYTVNAKNSVCFLFDVDKLNKDVGFFAKLENARQSEQVLTFPLSKQVENIGDTIKLEWQKSNFDNEKINSLFSILFLQFLEDDNLANKVLTKTESDNARYSDLICDFITNQYMNDVSLTHLSNYLNLSERQTARVVKKNFGETFSLLLKKTRLEIAVSYLVHTNLKISDVAIFSGFLTENYLFSQFKKEYGITPLSYRKRFQQKQ